MCLTLPAVAGALRNLGTDGAGTPLPLKPVMALTMEGKIEPVGRVRGRDAAQRCILELLDRTLTPRPRARRAELVARYRPRQCLVTPITPVIAAHPGIGAWGVFYQNEDGTNAETVRYD
jgi:fatty acid-binding protein DegV